MYVSFDFYLSFGSKYIRKIILSSEARYRNFALPCLFFFTLLKVKTMVIYEGPSELNGAPVVAILTGWKNCSQNIKTGDMAQIWVLYRDSHPFQAYKDGDDASICGDCKHRTGSCYVTIAQAPAAVYRAYKAGKYKRMPPNFKLHKPVRFGAYGDIAAVPRWAIEPFLNNRKNTSYSHQWRKFDLSDFSMASVDNLTEKHEATAKGYRTFRVTANDYLESDEIWCPNTTTGVQCRDCGLCAGNQIKAKNIVVKVHGTKATINKFTEQ